MDSDFLKQNHFKVTNHINCIMNQKFLGYSNTCLNKSDIICKSLYHIVTYA